MRVIVIEHRPSVIAVWMGVGGSGQPSSAGTPSSLPGGSGGATSGSGTRTLSPSGSGSVGA
jgi:hypothetical protein